MFLFVISVYLNKLNIEIVIVHYAKQRQSGQGEMHAFQDFDLGAKLYLQCLCMSVNCY